MLCTLRSKLLRTRCKLMLTIYYEKLKRKMDQATKLIDSLTDNKIAWTEASQNFSSQKIRLAGDAAISIFEKPRQKRVPTGLGHSPCERGLNLL